MKVFLGKNAPDDSYQTVGFRTNIDNICEANECVEICGPNILDFVPTNEHDAFIMHLISKLRHNGKLIIGGTDAISLSLSIFNKSISIVDSNAMIYGVEGEPKKCGITCLEKVRGLLMNHIKITKQIPGLNFIIEGVRP